MGYLVKWKGYGEEHNSWVDEHDAGYAFWLLSTATSLMFLRNAQDLIDHFWADKKKGKSGSRKSEPVKPKPKLVEKPSRKSLADVEPSVEPEVKKRGRPKKEDLPSETRDEEENVQRAKKKPRKSNGLSHKETKQESDEEEVGTMKKHMKVPSWEELIESIDTVEREDDGELYVFFTL